MNGPQEECEDEQFMGDCQDTLDEERNNKEFTSYLLDFLGLKNSIVEGEIDLNEHDQRGDG